MPDEPQDHYAKAVTALASAEANMRNPGMDPERREPQAQYMATYALTHAVLAVVEELRAGRGA